MNDAASLGFSGAQLPEALRSLARASGVTSAPEARAVQLLEPASLDAVLRDLAAAYQVECQPVTLSFDTLSSTVARSAPALFRVSCAEGTSRYLALLRAGPRRVRLATPSGRVVTLPLSSFTKLVTRELRASEQLGVERALGSAVLAPARHERARQRLEQELLRGRALDQVWLVAPAAGAPFPRLLRQAGVLPRTLGVLLTHFLAFAALLAGWTALFRGALGGALDLGWLVAWMLLLLTTVPLRSIETWLRGELALVFGRLLRRRLMSGVLRVDEHALKRDGVGRALSRVLETETLEQQALSGSLGLFTAVAELGVLLLLLHSLQISLGLSVVLLASALGVVATCARHYARRRAWVEQRLGLASQLLERMVGHRTRLAQLPAAHVDSEADDALASYLRAGGQVDRATTRITTFCGQGFPVLGVLTLLGLSREVEGLLLAIGLGCVLLATQGLQRLAQAALALVDARVAWLSVQALFRAGRTEPALALARLPTAPPEPGSVLISGSKLAFSYEKHGRTLLSDCSFEIRARDRILIEGPSGAGKSTLAGLLSGSLQPTAGSLLLRGFDLGSVGASAWRSRVGSVPQLHQNHIFTGSLAFNVLMGRHWPPRHGELELARIACDQLGLAPLIDRMPGGMHQMLGESGWRLSHGERSRIFLARALLQDTDVVLLDETFGALDPATLEQALGFVLEQSRALVLIAHPAA
jgi:ATP-binding cassette subfamily B protein